MENLGDWIYILVLGAIGLSSLFRSGKKKMIDEGEPQQAPPPDVVTPQTASDRDFWEIFDELEKAASDSVGGKTKTRKSTPKIQKTSPPLHQSQRPQSIPFLEGESEIERKIRQQGAMADTFDQEGMAPLVTADDFDDPDSLRKAVIYAEILNRKY